MSRAQKAQSFALGLLFFSLPFSIAGDDLAVGLLYLFGIWVWVAERPAWPQGKLNLWIPLFLAAAVLAAGLAPQPGAAFAYFQNFWRFGLPFMIAWALRDEHLGRHLSVLAGVTALIGVYALVQQQTGLDLLRSERLQSEYVQHIGNWHVVGAFSHHLTFGGVMLVISALLLPQALWGGWGPKQRVLFGLAGALAGYGVFASMGRSQWLGLAVALLVLAGFKLKRRAWILGLVVALGIGFLFSVHNYAPLAELVQKHPAGYRLTRGLSLQYNQDRLYMWEAGRRAAADHFFTGLGPAQGPALQPYYDQVAQEKNHVYDHVAATGVHNIYIQSLVDFGIIGLVALLCWWGWIFWAGWRAWKTEAAPRFQYLGLSVMVGLSGVFTAGFFENNFRDGEVQAAILTLHGLALWLYNRPRRG